MNFTYVIDEAARVLFVDDDPILREFARVNLSSPKATVDVASNGVEALERLALCDYDVMLVDLEMPVMDGFDTLTAVRADPRTRDLAVIVQTGREDVEAIDRAFRLGATSFVTKPLNQTGREDVEAIDRAFRLGATSFVTKPLNWRLLNYQIRYVVQASRAERRLQSSGPSSVSVT